MSLLSGVLSGGSLIDAALGKALDPSHHPFKRALYRPGGPGKRADEETHEWSCTSVGKYKQRCVNIHNPDRKPKIVKTSAAKKKKYNKAYRSKSVPRKSRNDPRFSHDVRDPHAAYQLPKAKKSRAKKAK